jgi:hypothetical protein
MDVDPAAEEELNDEPLASEIGVTEDEPMTISDTIKTEEIMQCDPSRTVEDAKVSPIEDSKALEPVTAPNVSKKNEQEGNCYW